LCFTIRRAHRLTAVRVSRHEGPWLATGDHSAAPAGAIADGARAVWRPSTYVPTFMTTNLLPLACRAGADDEGGWGPGTPGFGEDLAHARRRGDVEGVNPANRGAPADRQVVRGGVTGRRSDAPMGGVIATGRTRVGVGR
jgi:hypothetical protein